MGKVAQPKFGDIFFAVLESNGSVQGGSRPVIIAQNDIGNKYSPTVEIIPLSSNTAKAMHLPTHILILADEVNGLKKNSVVLTEQVQTINKSSLSHRIGSLKHRELVEIGKARQVQSPFPAQ